MADVDTTLSCRGCGARGLVPVLDLGDVPLANSLLTEEELDQPEDRYPLALFFCPNCTLAQIGETVSPDRLFRHYLYASSFSQTMVDHAKNLTHRLIDERGLTSDSLVVEIASNDGYLLQFYKEFGVQVLGVEPAENIAAIAEREKGIPTVTEFFGPELADKLVAEGRQADLIHAHNVFAHVPEPASIIAGCKRLLKADGLVLIEAPYVGELIRNLEFDTIYHEHFSYFSLTSVDHLVRRHGMMLADVELVPIHGGSLRLFIAHEGAAEASDNVREMLEREDREGMTGRTYYADFAVRVDQLKTKLNATLRDLKAQGHSIAAYGASAKGSTLMNAFGIGAETLDFVADRSTLKQDHFTPGNHLPIVAPSELMERRPDYVLLLTWNFADEILAQQQDYRDAGGHFIVPLPEIRIV